MNPYFLCYWSLQNYCLGIRFQQQSSKFFKRISILVCWDLLKKKTQNPRTKKIEQPLEKILSTLILYFVKKLIWDDSVTKIRIPNNPSYCTKYIMNQKYCRFYLEQQQKIIIVIFQVLFYQLRLRSLKNLIIP